MGQNSDRPITNVTKHKKTDCKFDKIHDTKNTNMTLQKDKI